MRNRPFDKEYDFTYDKKSAELLARFIRSYYSKWPHNVKVWVEQDSIKNGTTKRTFYSIRSNIQIKIPN